MRKKNSAAPAGVKTASMRMAEYDVEYLVAHKADYNPRTISDEHRAGLSLCLGKFGYVQPIIFNTRTERIVSGHQRVDLLAEQGYKRAQVAVVDLPENLEKELNIAMNSGTVSGEFTPAVNDLIQEILDSDAEFFDMLNLNSLTVGDDDIDATDEDHKPAKTEGVPGMEILPYEHYDCLLVVFKNIDDFLYLSSALKLDERRVISAPNVKNKKIGKLRAVSAEKLIAFIKSQKSDSDGLPEIDMDLDL